MSLAPIPARTGQPTEPGRPGKHPTRLLSGLAVAAIVTVVVLYLSRFLPTVSPMVVSLVLGAAIGSLAGALPRDGALNRVQLSTRPGTDWAAKHVLRAGVVLLGFQVSIPQVIALGWRGVAVVVLTMTVTFAATIAIGRRMGVTRAASLYLATGYSVCGAAAVSAMKGAAGPRFDSQESDEGAATALALVTVYGSLAVFILPWLAHLLGLDAHQSALWIGVSVQEVAQVVAAAGTISAVALTTATVAKLSRVALLAPLVAIAGVRTRRHSSDQLTPGSASTASATATARRPAPIPLFVVGFLIAVVIRSTGILPDVLVTVLTKTSTILFIAAMFGMGLGIDVPHLIRTGRRPLALGALSELVITTTALAGVLVLAP